MICLLFTVITSSYASALVRSEIPTITTHADYEREINKVFSEVSAGRSFVERVFTQADVSHLVGGEEWMEVLKSIVRELDQREMLRSDPALFTNKVMPRVHLISFVHHLSKILSEACGEEDEDQIIYVRQIIDGVVAIISTGEFDPALLRAVQTFERLVAKIEEYDLTGNEHMQKLLQSCELVLQYIVTRMISMDEVKVVAAIKIIDVIDEFVSQRPAVEQRHFNQLMGEVFSVSEEVWAMRLDHDAAGNDDSFQVEEIWGVLSTLCSIREVHEFHLL